MLKIILAVAVIIIISFFFVTVHAIGFDNRLGTSCHCETKGISLMVYWKGHFAAAKLHISHMRLFHKAYSKLCNSVLSGRT